MSANSHPNVTKPGGNLAHVPMKWGVIPVIFLPGIMGTNLKDGKGKPVWTVNSNLGVADQWAWGLTTDGRARKRKQQLDPKKTFVDDGGKLPSNLGHLSPAEAKKRGWTEISNGFYGEFLGWLEMQLASAYVGQYYSDLGLRGELMQEPISEARELKGLPRLTQDEVNVSYDYEFPVYAVGYNWLRSIQDAAAVLQKRVQQIIAHYARLPYRCKCSKVILVTHSMGGLVARYYSEVNGGRSNILGIVHGAIPATGAAEAYRRPKTGVHDKTAIVIGRNAAEVTPIFAQSPGALQLLPSIHYGNNWFRIMDVDKAMVSLPIAGNESTLYEQIYTNRNAWYNVVEDKLINPCDPQKKTINQDWANYTDLIEKQVKPFHHDLSKKYHPNTYVFYGEGSGKKTVGNITWERTQITSRTSILGNLLSSTRSIDENGKGLVLVPDRSQGKPVFATFQLQGPEEDGDGTVPKRSGSAPGKHAKKCVAFLNNFDHASAYDNTHQRDRQRFAFWGVVKVAYEVIHTPMKPPEK